MKRRTILAVDDETQLTSFIATLAQENGIGCDRVHNLTEAVAKLEQQKYETIVTDIYMGHENGFELMRKIRLLGEGVPLVVVTGFPSVEVATRALRLGAFDFLAKPFEPSDLIDTMTRATEVGALILENLRLIDELDALGSAPGQIDSLKRNLAAIQKHSAFKSPD